MGMEGKTDSRTGQRLAFRLVRIVDNKNIKKYIFNKQAETLTKNIEKCFLFKTKHQMKMESKT